MRRKQTQPDDPARRSGWAMAGAAAVLVLAALGVAARFANVYSGQSGGYICAHCGADRRVDQRAVLGVTYFDGLEVRNTRVSRVLAAHRRQNCAHAWYRTGGSSSGGALLGPQWVGCGGGVFGDFPELVYDADFAHELGKMHDPQAVWEAICKAKLAAPADTGNVVPGWLYTQGARQPFPQWWRQHGAHVKQLASGLALP